MLIAKPQSVSTLHAKIPPRRTKNIQTMLVITIGLYFRKINCLTKHQRIPMGFLRIARHEAVDYFAFFFARKSAMHSSSNSSSSEITAMKKMCIPTVLFYERAVPKINSWDLNLNSCFFLCAAFLTISRRKKKIAFLFSPCRYFDSVAEEKNGMKDAD